MLLQLTFSEAVPGFDPMTSLRAEAAELAEASRSADSTTFYVLAAGGEGVEGQGGVGVKGLWTGRRWAGMGEGGVGPGWGGGEGGCEAGVGRVKAGGRRGDGMGGRQR